VENLMRFLNRYGRRSLFALAAATCVAASATGVMGAGAVVRPASAGSGPAAPAGAAAGRGAVRAVKAVAAGRRYVTLFFSRSEVTAGDGCQPDDTGIARLDTTVAPYLRSLGMTGTGSLVTGTTRASAYRCTHNGDTLSASWNQATSLAQAYDWSFVSATGTYPGNLTRLPPAQQQAETCGSAATLDNHGLPGGHGMIAYPGAHAPPASIQAKYGAMCFAWGRVYEKSGLTTAAMGVMSPFWQFTRALNGGPCNSLSAPCYTVPSQGSRRYTEPSTYIAMIDALRPGQWLTLQAYILVTGKSPSYLNNGTRWNCNSPDPALHWSNDVERYCYNDFQQIVQAIRARGNIVVTDPLTVGMAFGRPATFR
jgi:hypothetical protein